MQFLWLQKKVFVSSNKTHLVDFCFRSMSRTLFIYLPKHTCKAGMQCTKTLLFPPVNYKAEDVSVRDSINEKYSITFSELWIGL